MKILYYKLIKYDNGHLKRREFEVDSAVKGGKQFLLSLTQYPQKNMKVTDGLFARRTMGRRESQLEC